MIYGREIAAVITGYLLGCICTGYYLVRSRTGTDIRISGSGSAGARNAGRILGKTGYAVTLAGDMAKGVLAVGTALLLGVERWAVVMTLLAVIVGHIWPVQLRFHGGKGAAVMLGALLMFDYRLLIVPLAVCALLYLCTRKYMLSTGVGVLLLPAAAVILQYPMLETAAMLALTLIIFFAHRKNLYEMIRPFRKSIQGRKT